MLVFCNDNQQRICKIRGAIKKSNWISSGDIVLLSVREDMGVGAAGGSAKADISDERGDILDKYDHSILGKLKKEPGINPKLFVQLETMDIIGSTNASRTLEGLNEDGEEDLFEDEGEDEEKEEKHETKPKSKNHRKDIVMADGSIDIDAI